MGLVLEHLAKLVQQVGQIILKALHRVTKRLDVGRLERNEECQERVERRGVLHERPTDLLPVLDEHDLLGVVKKDVGGGVAPPELLVYLFVKIVKLVFALPVAPVLAQRVFEGAVGIDGRAVHAVLEFGNQFQTLRVRIAVLKVDKRRCGGFARDVSRHTGYSSRPSCGTG